MSCDQISAINLYGKLLVDEFHTPMTPIINPKFATNQCIYIYSFLTL